MMMIDIESTDYLPIIRSWHISNIYIYTQRLLVYETTPTLPRPTKYTHTIIPEVRARAVQQRNAELAAKVAFEKKAGDGQCLRGWYSSWSSVVVVY